MQIQTCRRAPDLPGSTLPSQQACRISNPGPGMASHFMVLSLSPEPHSHLHRKRQGSPGPWGAGDGSQGAVAPQNAWAGGRGREEHERARSADLTAAEGLLASGLTSVITRCKRYVPTSSQVSSKGIKPCCVTTVSLVLNSSVPMVA